jgi:hypothetical protein
MDIKKVTLMALVSSGGNVTLTIQLQETSIDEKLNVKADKGMIHDMDGIGHWVPIRWYFPKNSYDLSQVMMHAEAMEKKYTELRELTCPDDND